MARFEHEEGNLSWSEWQNKLEQIGESLVNQGHSANIEIIGSGVLMKRGMEGRTSMDLDVWMPNSSIEDMQAFKRAVESSGLLFNPVDENLNPEAYIQLVEELKTMPDHKPEQTETLGNLSVSFPANEVVAASKLAAGRDKDIADLTYLASTGKLNAEKLEQLIEKIPNQFERETAIENKIFVDPRLFKQEQTKKIEDPAEKLVNELESLKEGKHGSIEGHSETLNGKLAVLLKNTVHKDTKLSAVQLISIKNSAQQFLNSDLSKKDALESIRKVHSQATPKSSRTRSQKR